MGQVWRGASLAGQEVWWGKPSGATPGKPGEAIAPTDPSTNLLKLDIPQPKNPLIMED